MDTQKQPQTQIATQRQPDKDGHTHTHTHTCTHARMHAHVRVHTCIHACAHTHTHTHTHAGRCRKMDTERNRDTETQIATQRKAAAHGYPYTVPDKWPHGHRQLH